MAQHKTKQVKHKTTRDNIIIIQYNTSITQSNMSTKEAWPAKIGLYFTFFDIELYIFLISFTNG